MEFITDLFVHYGYIVLFVALMLELIALPTPGETLMTYCGFLVFQGKLNWGISIIVASLGVIAGITISYVIGRTLGAVVFHKYGSYIHLGPDRMEKASEWFDKYGHGLLVIAYFIPGVRHITGYFSGITEISYRKFAFYAYLGAVIWTTTFVSLGRVLGENWADLHDLANRYLVIGGVIIAVVLLCIYCYRNYKSEIIEFAMNSLAKGMHIFHSLGRIRLVLVGIAAIFVALSIALVSLVHGFLANEFSQFDANLTFLTALIFPTSWSSAMELFRLPTAPAVLMVLVLLTLAWIYLRGRQRLLEARFLCITVLGGVLLEEVLRMLFHRVGPGLGNSYTFPSQQTLLAVVIYGFASFMVLRHARNRWFGSILFLITLAVFIITSVSVVFFQIQYPSDILAGCVFGGVWLSLNIILMEVFRVLPQIQREEE